MKIAIIGAGPAGLACARECERLGVVADVYERNGFIGWIWPSINCWLNLFERSMGGDILDRLKDDHGINIKPLSRWESLIMKSPNKEIKVDGNLGYFIERGAIPEVSLEKQLLKDLKQTPVRFNSPVDYKDLIRKYDYVVVASAKDWEAREMGVWEDHGVVRIRGAVAVGAFKTGCVTIYWNTDLTGHGYARITPFSSTQAIIGFYNIGSPEGQIDGLFEKFLEQSGLMHLELVYKFSLPAFTTGLVRRFKIGKVLLAGRGAGLTDRLMGCGGIECMISGIFAARAMIKDLDYDSLIKPLQDHIENISAFRKQAEKLDNQGYDRLLSLLGTTLIKQVVYRSGINFTDLVGGVLKKLHERNQSPEEAHL